MLKYDLLKSVLEIWAYSQDMQTNMEKNITFYFPWYKNEWKEHNFWWRKDQ